MTPREVDRQVLAEINAEQVVSVKSLAESCEVSPSTIRRALRRLEERSLIQRTWGGAARLEPSDGAEASATEPEDEALILAPVRGESAHTLRERALRRGIPFFAESCPNEGAIYLGPDNSVAAEALGVWTAEHLARTRPEGTPLAVVDISQTDLVNTRERSNGFARGFRRVLGDRATILTLDGEGLYEHAYPKVRDFFEANPEFDIIFGVNDDSVLAGIDAWRDLGRSPDALAAVNVGGEGSTILDALSENRSLKACMGLLPDVVGRLAVDGVAAALSGSNPEAIITPHVLLVPENLEDFYDVASDGWALKRDVLEDLAPPTATNSMLEGKRLGLVILYRTHEWYQSLAEAMATRCQELGMKLRVRDLSDGIAEEIRDLGRMIGKRAAELVEDGDTIILDTGSTTTHMVSFLHGIKDLTIFTNSLDVFERLQHHDEFRVYLIGGEYEPSIRAFVGPEARRFLAEIRTDKLFLVAGGLSIDFGVSSRTLEEADVRKSMVKAARQVLVLADHTVFGKEAAHRTADLSDVEMIITDVGATPAQRVQLAQLRLKVVATTQLETES